MQQPAAGPVLNQVERAVVGFGDRVATLAWNGHRHMELYYAVSGSGAVLHTLNPRLHPDQVVWIADHAQDQVMFFDLSFLPLVEAIAPRVKTIRAFVAMTSRAHMPASSTVANLLCYEDLLDAASPAFDWPVFDEQTASSLCYTSGTTGHPKGVLYSHRSTLLHTYAAALPDALNCCARDTVLPVVDRMRQQMRQDELEDLVGTVGQTFLGLTVNCARCHDHKFDPISQQDYYQLAAALAGVNHGEKEIQPPEVRRQLAEWQQEIDRLAAELKVQTDELRRRWQERNPGREAAVIPAPVASWDFTAGLSERQGGPAARLRGARCDQRGRWAGGRRGGAAADRGGRSSGIPPRLQQRGRAGGRHHDG